MLLDMLSSAAPVVTKQIGIHIPVALDRALHRAFPETAEHGYSEYRVHRALMAFLRDRGIDITAEVAAAVSRREPRRAAPVRKRTHHAHHGRRRRR